MMKNIRNKFYHFALAAAALGTVACSKPKVEDHGISDPSLDASFTVTPVSGSANRFVLTSNDSSYIMSKWDLGDGLGASIGPASQSILLADAGTYTITHYAFGKGGNSASASKTVTVATSDPAYGNVIQGGKFESAADDAKWTRLNIAAPAVAWTMANGKITASGGSWGHSAIYQQITVQANKKYRFSALVSGNGATDTWFEVYFGTAAPVQGSDYTNGGNYIGLNTWSGCGNTSFSGNLSSIGCSGTLVGKNGEVTFTTGGTLYLVIKTGGANLGTEGISIDNIVLRGI